MADQNPEVRELATESVCDHCGKPSPFNVLCGECEELVCNECGRVECVCALHAPPPSELRSAPASFGEFQAPTSAPVELVCRVSVPFVPSKLFVLGPPVHRVELFADGLRCELSEREGVNFHEWPCMWDVAPAGPAQVLRLVMHPAPLEVREGADTEPPAGLGAGVASVIGLVPRTVAAG